jgi:hypothetical protein
MFSKRMLIVMLAGVNLLLLAGLILSITRMPAAYAQDAGRPGDFVMATAEVDGRDADILYLLDVPKHRLHAFLTQGPQSRRLDYIGFRSLDRDFEPPR